MLSDTSLVSTQGSGANANFNGWTTVGATGTATHDGMLVITSIINAGISASTSGTQRLYVAARDRYGQGSVSATVPIMKGETWSITGAQTIWFMQIGS